MSLEEWKVQPTPRLLCRHPLLPPLLRIHPVDLPTIRLSLTQPCPSSLALDVEVPSLNCLPNCNSTLRNTSITYSLSTRSAAIVPPPLALVTDARNSGSMNLSTGSPNTCV